jgi:hypothetical protein
MNFIFNRTETALRPETDLCLPADLVPWVARRMEEEALAAVVYLPAPEGWVSWTLTPAELATMAAGAAEVWITQRSGCGGLVTRLLLLDEDGATIGSIGTPPAPGTTEPVAWRVILLTALLAADLDRVDAQERRAAAQNRRS